MRIRLTLLLSLAVVTALSGCGLLRKDVDYGASKEGRPLEIPPDLDTPSTTGALTIPSGSAAASTSAPDAAPISEIDSTGAATVSAGGTSAEPPAPVMAGEDSTLRVGDGVAGAWRRVGLALNRAGVGQVAGSDESSATYTLTGVTQASAPPEGGFISRMFKKDQQTSVEATRIVRIVADGDGSLIKIEDEKGEAASDEFARRIIAALKQRLG
jgi:uncharacterized lipoprotein